MGLRTDLRQRQATLLLLTQAIESVLLQYADNQPPSPARLAQGLADKGWTHPDLLTQGYQTPDARKRARLPGAK